VTARTFFIANRFWWGGALFIAPIVAAIFGDPLAGLVAAAVLVLPAFIIFDTDRGWWTAEVKALPEDKDRSKSELRLLTTFAACALATGVVIAYLLG
jgi:heme A synthase